MDTLLGGQATFLVEVKEKPSGPNLAWWTRVLKEALMTGYNLELQQKSLRAKILSFLIKISSYGYVETKFVYLHTTWEMFLYTHL